MYTRPDGPVLESLEPRLLMDASPMLISEETDFGDTQGTAQAIYLDINHDLAIDGSIHSGGEEDVFRFGATFTGLMTVNFSHADGSGLDTVVHAYNGAGGFLADNDDASGTDSQITFAVVAGGTYWIRAHGADGTAGEYMLTLQGTQHYDLHGDTTVDATAFTLDADGQALLDGAINNADDEDFYTFTADEDRSMTVTMTGGDNALDSVLYVYDSEGNVVAVNDNYDGTDSQVRFDAAAGESYYIRATNRAGSVGEYSLAVQGDPIRDDAGDTLADATAVSLDGALEANINGTFETHGDVDMFSFIAEFDGDMTVTMDGGDRLDPVLTLYDANGNVIDQNDDADGLNAALTFTLQAGQQYFIEAADFASATGTYVLSMSGTPDSWAPTESSGIVQSEVIASVKTGGDGTYLYVEGTDGDDEIRIDWSEGTFSIYSDYGLQTITAAVNAVGVYGFGGSDTITLMYDVRATAYVFAGDSADAIYANSQGYSELYAGAGDDLIVAIDEGADKVYGQAGYDRFWLDSVDTLDADMAEQDAGAVHRVTQFYQPWTDDSSSSDYVSLQIDSQSLRDPSASADHWEDFSDHPLFEGITYDDADQGAVGDCYYLAALSSLAHTDPDVIENTITALGDGTYAVRYYDAGEEVYLRIDGDLPVNAYGGLVYQRLGQGGDIWMPLMEKAYAHFRTGANTYSSIAWGWMSTVYTEVTGESSLYVSTSQWDADLYNQLETAQIEGHAITLGSFSSQPSGSPIVGSHAYVVHDVGVDEDGNQYVEVYNPWGSDGRSYDDNSHDGLLKLSISDISRYFSGGAMATV